MLFLQPDERWLPQVTPTWVDIDKSNNIILVNTARGRVKHRNISKDPRVATSLVDFSNPYDMVTLRGKVIEQISGKTAEEHIDELAKKNLDQEKYPRRKPGEERVLLRIKPEACSSNEMIAFKYKGFLRSL